ncbi:MAG: DUF21 domain-containing protein [Verrucomicrobia bacterium]|nr:DUF21 domain-containing protein [Verrucomicrobiota bacterium]MBS0636634.1 DUF21 domain-containing protein [Verrucomicrobiota bacterium]
MAETTFWLVVSILWTAVLSFYSMQEMACISCNKLRLDYAVAQKERTAIWLQKLLASPQLLFSTTLVGVNVAMMMSSESFRRLFEAWNLDPNMAPIVTIPFLLVFGELIPMFAARLYPDHASRLGIPLLYASAMVLRPITSVISYFLKSEKQHTPVLSREELQKLLEEHQAGYLGEQASPENDLMANIFSLRAMRAYQLMQKLDTVICLPSNASVGDMRDVVKRTGQLFFPLFHRYKNKIVGMVYLQDLLQQGSNKRVDQYSKPTIFVPYELSALEIIHKLQDEEQSSAIVISPSGEAKGIIFLEDLIDELFGSDSKDESEDLRYLEKTIPADTLIEEFNATYDTEIEANGCKTFSDLIEKSLGRHPRVNEMILIDPFELIIKETSLFKAKTIQIRNKTP